MDFVLPWVDGSDPVWRKQYHRYKLKETGDKREARFRSWNNLKYWFRGVEVYAPWVNTIHFITFGHYPDWLNINHPKLHIVNHSDFIPDKYLPTFNSRVFALNLHRISNLSERYVYFNDDIFVIDSISPKHFFRKNKPCDMAISNALTGYPHSFTILKNISIINKYFSKHAAISQHPLKWINLKYGLQNLRTMLLLPWDHTGFYNHHLPQPGLKKTLNLLWEKEYRHLNEACLNKFRDYKSVNAYLQRYWELASNNFYPFNFEKIGKYCDLHDMSLDQVLTTIENQKKKIITLNDQEVSDFERVRDKVNSSLKKILTGKSSFEQ